MQVLPALQKYKRKTIITKLNIFYYCLLNKALKGQNIIAMGIAHRQKKRVYKP